MASVTLPPIDPVSSGPIFELGGDEDDEEEPPLDESVDPKDLYQRPKPAPPEWIVLVLEAVNIKRRLHWTPPVVWSELGYEYAKRQADTCSMTGKLKSGLTDTVQGRFGQCCLGPQGGPFRMNRKDIAEKVVDKWYSEVDQYNFSVPGHLDKSKNFEQLLWFGTTSVSMAFSKDGKFVIANFFPAGADASFEHPADKARRLYFPPGHDVMQMTNFLKYQAWFKVNVLPVQAGLAPWLGGEDDGEPTEDERGRTASSKGNRSASPDSPKGGGRKSMKKQKSMSPSRKSMSPSRKSISAGSASPKTGKRKTVKKGEPEDPGVMSPSSPKPSSPKPKPRKSVSGSGRKSSPKSSPNSSANVSKELDA